MLIYPAIHIAQFGVFPDKKPDEFLIEGLTAAQSTEHEIDIASEFLSLAGDVNDLLRAEGKEIDEQQNKIAKTAALRMRNAYQFVVKQGWIKPIRGDVCLANAVRLGPDALNTVDNLETAALSVFYEMIDGFSEPQLTLRAPVQEQNPVAIMAFIRCVVSGEAVPFSMKSRLPYAFMSVAAIPSEPDLDPAWFDLADIDTFMHCKSKPHTPDNLRLLGHGGFPPQKHSLRPV